VKPTKAREILAEYAPSGESWPRHCQQAGRVAARLCQALTEANPEFNLDCELIESQALLHDIGRCKTHGPLHGWSGYVMLRELGHHAAARGCLTHWIKGRTRNEVLAADFVKDDFVEKVFAELGEFDWSLADSIVSIADSSVAHTTIVPINDRHDELIKRYGDSTWMRRAAELAQQHAQHIEQHLDQPVFSVLSDLFGNTLHE